VGAQALRHGRPAEPSGASGEQRLEQRAAVLAGLSAAEATLDSFGGRTVLVVRRFDREESNGRLRRIHQEDGCQALGVDPAFGKYQTLDGTASYRRLAAVLAAHAADVQGELRKLAALMVFTIAIGNTDAHLRNHAFLHSGSALSLAPIYDAAPAVEFAATRQLALWIDEQPLLSAVTRGQLLREMTVWGLSADDGEAVFDSTLASLLNAYPQAASDTHGVKAATVDACVARAERLLRSS